MSQAVGKIDTETIELPRGEEVVFTFEQGSVSPMFCGSIVRLSFQHPGSPTHAFTVEKQNEIFTLTFSGTPYP